MILFPVTLTCDAEGCESKLETTVHLLARAPGTFGFTPGSGDLPGTWLADDLLPEPSYFDPFQRIFCCVDCRNRAK